MAGRRGSGGLACGWPGGAGCSAVGSAVHAAPFFPACNNRSVTQLPPPAPPRPPPPLELRPSTSSGFLNPCQQVCSYFRPSFLSTLPPAAGQLGEVLGESARIALSWVRAHAEALGLRGGSACPSFKWDVHIHLPAGAPCVGLGGGRQGGPERSAGARRRRRLACFHLHSAAQHMPALATPPLITLRRGRCTLPLTGAVQKDGPSAGVTLAVALVSLFTDKCVRADVAMTGAGKGGGVGGRVVRCVRCPPWLAGERPGLKEGQSRAGAGSPCWLCLAPVLPSQVKSSRCLVLCAVPGLQASSRCAAWCCLWAASKRSCWRHRRRAWRACWCPPATCPTCRRVCGWL